MDIIIARHDALIRLGIFFAVLFLIMLFEKVFPRRRLSYSRFKRWPSNLLLVFFNGVLVRLVFPVVAVGVAVLAQEKGWGLLNNLSINYWVKVVTSFIAFDFIIYLQHVMFHAVPLFWKIHRMHHTDLDFDTTTGLRFHPIEIALSMLIKISAVLVLGAPAFAVILFEILLNATAMFNHSNIKLPLFVDRYLRLFIVTPDMHRVHHSIIMKETNSNYGFNLPWWDRLCGTYIPQPKAGHLKMTIGIETFRDPKFLRLDRLLVIPFLSDKK